MSKTVLTKLRSVMQNTAYVPQRLQAYIIPSCDAHQSEYIAACDKRRAFITGFTGSAGTAVVTENLAALWTDGRYFLQAEKELGPEWKLMKDGIPGTPTEGEWLSEVLPAGSRVGLDPLLVSYAAWNRLSEILTSNGHSLIPVKNNLIDVVWEDRPPVPNNPVFALPIKYTGLTWEQKVKQIWRNMTEKKATVLLITALDEIAWLLNLRGSDIEYNPVFFAYAVITEHCVNLFIDDSRLTESIKSDLLSSKDVKVVFHPYNSITDFVEKIDKKAGTKIWLNEHASYGLVSCVPKEYRVCFPSPVAVKKAIKNEQEIKCMKNAHVKDAVALCDFFAWLETNIKCGTITEISAAEKLEEFRRQQDEYVGPSFQTISASGPNGSLIHYKPGKKTNRTLTQYELYLCDSGAQFRDGTTDVTRTWHFGTPSAHEKECYTRVLKGVISLSSAVFPKLTKGQMLDTLARKALWDVGLDYLHGTGHGVGLYLNVHEGPMGISWRPHPDDPGFQKGMVLSIEPGYYEDDEFGIRIENLAVVVKTDTKFNFKQKGFLTFDPLTLVPIQTKLLNPSLLTTDEIEWLNDYHSKCQEVVGKALQEQGKIETLKWLNKETQALG